MEALRDMTMSASNLPSQSSNAYLLCIQQNPDSVLGGINCPPKITTPWCTHKLCKWQLLKANWMFWNTELWQSLACPIRGAQCITPMNRMRDKKGFDLKSSLTAVQVLIKCSH
jgi:hypothetical protein